MSQLSARIVACLLNISEARNASIVDRVAHAAVSPKSKLSNDLQEFPCLSTVLNVFRDHDYNRSVITIAAPVEDIEECVLSACKVAYQEINLHSQQGIHPRLGSVDLIPIHPLAPSVSLEECGLVARAIAEQITKNIPGTSAFLFGFADVPQRRGLVQRRKEVNWFSGKSGIDYSRIGYDIGCVPSSRYGCTGIGALPYVMNCNVTMDCDDLQLGTDIAKVIRGSSPGGFKGLQSMAFRHEGRIEVACNVEAYEEGDKKFVYAQPDDIETKIKALAADHGVSIYGTKLVGFTPEEAYRRAAQALKEGDACAWKRSAEYRM